jgi:hypothetical protein
MKKIKQLVLLTVLLPLGFVAAAPLTVQDVNALPENCRVIGEIKVGDIAWGKSHADVVAGLKKEAADLGANYLLMDIKRVNNPKQGVYYWGWGTAGVCK